MLFVRPSRWTGAPITERAHGVTAHGSSLGQVSAFHVTFSVWFYPCLRDGAIHPFLAALLTWAAPVPFSILPPTHREALGWGDIACPCPSAGDQRVVQIQTRTKLSISSPPPSTSCALCRMDAVLLQAELDAAQELPRKQ